MKPIIEPHQQFRNTLRNRIKALYPDLSVVPKAVWDLYNPFSGLDLSKVDEIMQVKYSVFGPKPRTPSCMFRSLLLMAAVKCHSFTEWAKQLKIVPVYAVISGFAPDDVPGVGTFYDFLDRIWDISTNNFSPNVRPSNKKVKKPNGKGQKAESVEKESTEDLINRLKTTTMKLKDEAFGTLLSIFQECVLEESVRRGVIHPENIRMAGDGTPIVTSQRLRKHHTCDCPKKGIYDCDCDRYYSQPDCDVGWDSSRDKYYVGYDMYILTDTERDLPIFFMLEPASKHDSHGFQETYFRLKSYLPEFKPSQLLLDSAHDSMAMYSLCLEDNVQPFIDLNLGNSKKTEDYHGVTLGPDGVPVCPIGIKMKSHGNDLQRQYAKFICPKMKRGVGCTCENPCSVAKYGRTCSIPLETNIRLYNSPPRGSDEWTKTYNSRTASERCNKKIKIDYRIEEGRHRSSKLWYIKSYLIAMLLHIDAWNSK